MMQTKQQSRFISAILALAVFVVQSSFVFASMDMYTSDSDNMNHCMMSDKSEDKELPQKQVKQVVECCSASDCTNHFCVPGASHSSSAVFISTILLHSSVYAQSVLDTLVQDHSGTDTSSLYRPPRTHS